MTDIGFAPKVVIAPQVCRLEVLDANKADTYGPQIAVKLKVVDGEHDGHTFTDYADRDEYTGRIKQGSKAWTIFEACLGLDFYKRSGVSLRDLVGKQFVAQVTQTRTSSRNKLEFGTIGPLGPQKRPGPEPGNDGANDDTFNDLPW